MKNHLKKYLIYYLVAFVVFVLPSSPELLTSNPFEKISDEDIDEFFKSEVVKDIESKSFISKMRNFGDLETKFKTEIEEPALRSSKYVRKGQSSNTGRFSLSPGGSSGNAGKGVTRGRFRLFAGGGGSGGSGGGGGAGSLYIRGIGKRHMFTAF